MIITRLKQLDWVLIGAVVLLVGLGLISLYSSSVGRHNFLNFEKQIVFFVLGLILMFIFSFLDWRVWRENNILVLILYAICILSLIGLYFLAPEIRGVRKWYKIGLFSIDPVEFTKFVLIIILAKYFSRWHVEIYRIRHILFSGCYIFLPGILIFFQPDFGSVLILLLMWLGVLLVSGIKLRHFLILVVIGVLVLSLSWVFLMKDYQKERIISFIAPRDPLGINWNQNQAKIAIGSGGIWGKGLLKGSQTQYGFLPEPQTDFIFAALAEETGLVGVTILLLLFLILIWRLFKIALISQSNFPRLFNIGVIIILISQIFINLGMNLGILPIIGIPLPLVSYGGSSLFSIFLILGVSQSIRLTYLK
ncbi:MAG: rod shape-determining protein RodA [Minisyncoccales bacterium]